METKRYLALNIFYNLIISSAAKSVTLFIHIEKLSRHFLPNKLIVTLLWFF